MLNIAILGSSLTLRDVEEVGDLMIAVRRKLAMGPSAGVGTTYSITTI